MLHQLPLSNKWISHPEKNQKGTSVCFFHDAFQDAINTITVIWIPYCCLTLLAGLWFCFSGCYYLYCYTACYCYWKSNFIHATCLSVYFNIKSEEDMIKENIYWYVNTIIREKWKSTFISNCSLTFWSFFLRYWMLSKIIAIFSRLNFLFWKTIDFLLTFQNLCCFRERDR